jgi:hypothetical protein
VRVWGLGLRLQGIGYSSGCGVQGLGLGFRVYGLEFRVRVRV